MAGSEPLDGDTRWFRLAVTWSRGLLVRPYRVQKDPSLDPILSQINPVHSIILSFLKIYFNGNG
jgi:hypothetical protein